MKKLLLALVGVAFATSILAADYEVYDVKIKGAAVYEDYDEVGIDSGSAKGWLIYDWDTGTATFILLDKGYCEQGSAYLDVYDYYDSSSESSTKYTERGVTELWFDIYFSDVNTWGCAVGKYIWTVDLQTYDTTSKCNLKGAGSLLIDDYFGGYVSPMQVKSNTKMTHEINEAYSAESYMEDMCYSKTKWPINLSWEWNSAVTAK